MKADTYRVGSLLENHFYLHKYDDSVKKEVKSLYDKIKFYIKDVVKYHDKNKIVLLISTAVKLPAYRNAIKFDVVKNASKMVDLVFTGDLSSVENNSFYKGNVEVIVRYTLVDPKAVQRKQISTLKKIFNELYETSSSSGFSVKIGNSTYTFSNYDPSKSIQELPAVSATNRTETKADCIITANSGNIYISLKGNEFQQWGGMSGFNNYQDVTSFVEAFKQYQIQNKTTNPQPCSRVIKDDTLYNQSVYGKKYGGSTEAENVDHIIIGESIGVRAEGNKHVLTAKKIYDNGDKVDSIYEPHLYIRYDSNRNDFGISNVRALMWPGNPAGAKNI